MLQPSDEIKSKLDIVDIIREYIPLKPAGVNFRALCPFHREKSPSFVVSPEKQIWHCFGCSKGGDIFSFVMEMDGLSFVESLRALAPKAGVTLRKQDPKLTSQRNRLLDILELSRKYYQGQLRDDFEAEPIRKYLFERGLTLETIDLWQIGYSHDSWDDLFNFLKSKGYKENEIFMAGMAVKKESTNRFYNRFRGRIMFPINDINGNAVAFSARVNPRKEEEEVMGKYINSPQTMVYDKSKILFGLDKAKQEIKKRDLTIVAEGQMDVITAHQYGYKNVIALSGTALTGEQVMLLKRYSNNVALAFDMDAAGKMAAERGIKEAMQAGMNIKVVEALNGKDPDECIKNNPEEWEKAVKNAKSVMQYYFDKTFTDLDLSHVDDKRKAAEKLLPTINRLGNKIEQDFWLKKLAQAIDVRDDILYETLKNAKLRQKTPKYAKETPSDVKEVRVKQSREEMMSELLLAMLVKFPRFIEWTIKHIHPDQIIGLPNQNLYRSLVIYYNNIIDNQIQGGAKTELPGISYTEFKSWLLEMAGEPSYATEGALEDKEPETQILNHKTSAQISLLDSIALLGDRDFYDYNNEQAKNEIIKIVVGLKRYYLINRRKEIEKLIVEVEQNGDKEHIKGLMEEFKALTDEIQWIGS